MANWSHAIVGKLCSDWFVKELLKISLLEANVFIFRGTGFKYVYLNKFSWSEFYICICIYMWIYAAVYILLLIQWETQTGHVVDWISDRISISNSTDEPNMYLYSPKF